MNVHDITNIMSRRVVAFKKTAKVRDIAKKMSQQRISCVVIIEKSKLIGIITERDLIKKVISANKNPESVTASEIMSSPTVTAQKKASITQIAQIMKKKRIRRIVITDKKKVVGVVTQTDLMKGLIYKIKHLNWQLVHSELSLDEYIGSLEKIKMSPKIAPKKTDS